MAKTETKKRWSITSTWGRHHVLAENERAAEEAAEEQLDETGHGDQKILDGLTEEYNPDSHGEWEGDCQPMHYPPLSVAGEETHTPLALELREIARHAPEGEPALRAAGLRELHEEAGILLGDPGELVAFSRWITPAEVKIRYDTWFFLATMPAGQEARIDGAEVVDARWFSPPAALAASRRNEILLVFPTIKHLEQLSAFRSAGELLSHARAQTVQPVQPQVLGQGEMARIVLPGEPGYEDRR